MCVCVYYKCKNSNIEAQTNKIIKREKNDIEIRVRICFGNVIVPVDWGWA